MECPERRVTHGYTQRTRPGGEISLVCDTGYYPSGPNPICVAGTEINGDTPSCLQNCRPNDVMVPNGYLVPMVTGSRTIRPGEGVRVRCRKGYTQEGQTEEGQCVTGARFNPVTFRGCKPAPCPLPAAPEKGAFSSRDTLNPGEIVHVTCEEGYDVTDPPSFTCVTGATFQPATVPQCRVTAVLKISMALPYSQLALGILSLYALVTTLLGFFGNAIVLYSSFRYNAIHLDSASLVFVQNLALADLLYTIIVLFPSCVTYLANDYVLGDVYCKLTAQLSFLPGSANCLLVLTITSYKLKMLITPLLTVSTRPARGFSVGVWLVALSLTFVSLGYKSTSSFNPYAVRCLSSIYSNEDAETLFKILYAIIVTAPIFLITILNCVILVIACQASRKRIRKGILTVAALSGLFIVSLTPFTVCTFMKGEGETVPPFLDLIASHCIFLNTCGNPLLYTITNRRFGRYIRTVTLKGCVRGWCSSPTTVFSSTYGASSGGGGPPETATTRGYVSGGCVSGGCVPVLVVTKPEKKEEETTPATVIQDNSAV
eukprot:sb/3463667/